MWLDVIWDVFKALFSALKDFCFIALFIFAFFSIQWTVFTLPDKISEKNSNKERSALLVKQERFWKIADNILENTDLDACIEDLKMTYNVVFEESPESSLSLGMIGSLAEYRVAILGGEQSTSPDKEVNLSAVINKLRADAPYSDLPGNDRGPLLNIKARLEAAVPSDISEPLMSNLANIIVSKNNEIQNYQNETRAANRWSVVSGIIAIISVAIWIYEKASRRRREPPPQQPSSEKG